MIFGGPQQNYSYKIEKLISYVLIFWHLFEANYAWNSAGTKYHRFNVFFYISFVANLIVFCCAQAEKHFIQFTAHPWTKRIIKICNILIRFFFHFDAILFYLHNEIGFIRLWCSYAWLLDLERQRGPEDDKDCCLSPKKNIFRQNCVRF